MKRLIWGFMTVLIIGLSGCRKDKDPQPSLPDYLTMPSSLTNYKGSGQITIQGDLSLQAQGPEQVQANGNYSGVSGAISAGDLIVIQSTFDQPVSFSDRLSIPSDNRSNAQLRIMNTLKVGSYPMGLMDPNVNGAIADLSIDVPGPVYYITQDGSLTVDESTVLKTENGSSLYRVKGSLDANLLGGPKTLHVTGTFDVLLVAN